MKFEPKKHYTRETILHNPRILYGLNIALSHFVCSNGKPVSIFKLECGPTGAQIDITPAQCREFAAHLLAHASEFEDRCAQHEALNLVAA